MSLESFFSGLLLSYHQTGLDQKLTCITPTKCRDSREVKWWWMQVPQKFNRWEISEYRRALYFFNRWIKIWPSRESFLWHQKQLVLGSLRHQTMNKTCIKVHKWPIDFFYQVCWSRRFPISLGWGPFLANGA